MFYKTARFDNCQIIEINKNNSSLLYKEAAMHWKNVDAFPERYRSLFSNYMVANKIRVGEYNPEFKYYRVIAMHGDEMNQNGDYWRWGSLESPDDPELLRYDKSLGMNVFSSFNGRGSFKNHNNDDVSNAVGLVLDTIPNHKEKSIEALVAVDKIKDPGLVRGIDMGYVSKLSMGCLCGHSICSICGHKAYNENQYCEHITQMKAQTIFHEGEYKQVYEDNRQCCFIELSWVDVPADSGANLLEKVATSDPIELSDDAMIMYEALEKLIKDASIMTGNDAKDYVNLMRAIRNKAESQILQK